MPSTQLSRPPSRRTLLVGAAVLVAVALALGGSFRTGQHSPSGGGAAIELNGAVGTGAAVRTDPGAAPSVARAEQQFALDLLRHVPTAAPNESLAPASLALALAMLDNGAAGRTRSEISTVLGLEPPTLNAGWRALNKQLASAAAAGSLQLASADSAWLQRGLAVSPGYLDALRTFYDTGVWTVDFARHNAQALAAIDAWTAQHTHGRITKLFDSLDPGTLLALANAVYFKADWQTPFRAEDTTKRAFDVPLGRPVTTEFLTGVVPANSAVTPAVEAVQLPYAGGRFAALAVMPRTADLPKFVAGLSVAGLDSIIASLRAGPVQVSLPRFTTETTSQLAGPLAAMGMPSAFTTGADFSAMTRTPVSVSQVVQRVYLKVAEKGTEAAAASGIGIAVSGSAAPPRTVVIDHPFLFLVRDTVTGTILFAARITDPSAG